jgi:hypothetical protein
MDGDASHPLPRTPKAETPTVNGERAIHGMLKRGLLF